jgi:hypothetical protein
MKRVIQVLRENKLRCYPNERFSLDIEMFPDGTVPEAKLPSTQARFENPMPDLPRHGIDLPNGGSAFRYFLDGSQRSHRVLDADFGGRYLPICAGQVGVAVMERCNGHIKPVRQYCSTRNILAVPDRMEDATRLDLERKINAEMPDHQRFKVVCYQLKADEDEDPGDLGRAKIIHEMQLLELDTMRQMIETSRLSVDLLAKDGSLQYRDEKVKDLGFHRHDEALQLANVVGISKSFRPNYVLGGSGKRVDLGNLVSGLDFKERSIVVSPDRTADVRIGWWYLRIRPKARMTTPLQGIVKVEVFATTPAERDSGILVDRADTVSSYVIAERNVTPFDRDTRWANHLYPIYLAETYLKSSFLSPTAFKSIVF